MITVYKNGMSLLALNSMNIFNSIKSQIILVLTLMVLLLVSQLVITREQHQSYVSGIDSTKQIVEQVNLVAALERDVLDIQRNVLIYKETASNSSLTKFSVLMKQLSNNLNILEQMTRHSSNVEQYNDYILRMRGHLSDYQENFATVTEGRKKRKLLFEQGLMNGLQNIEEMLQEALDNALSDQQQTQLLLYVRLTLSEAKGAALQYIISLNFDKASQFKANISIVKEVFNSGLNFANSDNQFTDTLDKISNDFILLTNTTRGYTYLVNVVMTGSANEFLYLVKELNQLAATQLTKTNEQVRLNIEDSRLRINIFSVIGILMVWLIAIFLAYRIMYPINEITDIFKKLAGDKSVGSITGLGRKDEIGQLAKAADVFHGKNLQTKELLNESQLLVSRQDALNQELALSKHKAEQATQSKSVFLANMSHEIRTPMNGIVGLIDLTMKTELSDQQREYLTKVSYSTQILMSLINDILDFSKIEAGKLDIEQVQLSTNELFENLLGNITTRAQETNINIRFEADPKLPSNMIGDPLRISQVLLNLCSNALKFTQHGSVTIKVGINPCEQENQAMLQVEVIDTGIGMTPNQLAHVFDSFTQADGSTSRKFGGTGLGLSIVKELVKLMEGEINASSEAGVGSTFKVSFKVTLESPKQFVFDFSSEPEHRLFYFSHDVHGFINDPYLAQVDPNYKQYPTSELEDKLSQLTPNDIVLVDVMSKKHHDTIKSSLAQLIDESVRIGFVTDTQPSMLATNLTQKWQAPSIAHPFTGGQLMAFLLDVYPNNSKSRKIEETPAEQTQQFEGHILLVEDNNINQLVGGEILKLLGLTFDLAEDGEQAITKIVNSPHYDLVLMDIQMPVMDGYLATEQLRKQGYNDLIICGLSANAMKQDFDKAFACGMNDYVAKPIKSHELSKILIKYLPTRT